MEKVIFHAESIDLLNSFISQTNSSTFLENYLKKKQEQYLLQNFHPIFLENVKIGLTVIESG
jgi:hypothetical protein